MLSESDMKRLGDVLGNIKGDIKLAFSHQIEDVILLDMLAKLGILPQIEVFTLDTQKLFEQSLAHQREVERHFGIEILRYCASGEELEAVEREIGDWGMRESLEKRKKCCFVRKILPLRRALEGASAWISGIRAAQSMTRAHVGLVEDDAQFGLQKINPLFDWDDAKVWEYANAHDLPKNPLYAQGFASIGCAPCTRAIEPGESIRAGRWWWEDPAHKECGLHRR